MSGVMNTPVPYQVQPNTIYSWDALTTARTMRACGFRVNCVVTSPPYFGLRDYGVDGQLGMERTPDEYVKALVGVFRVIRDVLTDDGSVWLNIGDSYASKPVGRFNGGSALLAGRNLSGHATSGGMDKSKFGIPEKNLLMIPARLALALQADGWIVRQDNVWHKPNPMPDPVQDRTTRAHEYVFHLVKSARYYYDFEAIAEPASGGGGGGFSQKYANAQPAHGAMTLERPKNRRVKQDAVENRMYTGFNERWKQRGDELEVRNKRSVWEIPTQPFPGAHFAVMPEKLVEPCVLAGCPVGGVVYDPFSGAGTVAVVSRRHGRQYVGSEINPEYVAISRQRLRMPFEQHYVKPDNDVSDLPLFAVQEQPA